mgnify:CR=1 FL=1
MVLGLKEGVGAQYLRCTELGQGFQQGISGMATSTKVLKGYRGKDVGRNECSVDRPLVSLTADRHSTGRRPAVEVATKVAIGPEDALDDDINDRMPLLLRKIIEHQVTAGGGIGDARQA